MRGRKWGHITSYDEKCGIPLSVLSEVYSSSLSGAKSRNLDFDLTPVQLVRLARKAAGRCTLTGIPWDYDTTNRRGKKPWKPSLDRIDTLSGYTETNCRFICAAVNIALSDFGDDVLLRIAKGLLSMGQ